MRRAAIPSTKTTTHSLKKEASIKVDTSNVITGNNTLKIKQGQITIFSKIENVAYYFEIL